MNRETLGRIVLLVMTFVGCPKHCWGGSEKYPPCYSAFESKLRGHYLCSVSAKPNVVTWKGKIIKIKEAWLEQAHEQELLRSRTMSHYNLCIKLATGGDVLLDIPGKAPFFVLEGKGRSFAMRGTIVLWEGLDKIESAKFNVHLTDNWMLDNAIKIELSAAKFPLNGEK